MIGTILGDRFELIEPIGRGHLGIVYKARILDSEELVAVKILQRSEPRSILRFQREARAACNQLHPHIARVYEVGSTKDYQAFIVMELVDGISLRMIVRREAPLPLRRLARIGSQVCDALDYLHGNGIVHRDIKPANIMVLASGTTDEWIKLVDFGLAKPIEPEPDAHDKITLPGHVTGTPTYMSPEQCLARKVDGRSDIYSLGCVLYRAATGFAPVVGATARDTMNKQVAGDIVDFEILPPDIYVDPRLQEIIRRALAREPRNRYQTAREMKKNLDMICD